MKRRGAILAGVSLCALAVIATIHTLARPGIDLGSSPPARRAPTNMPEPVPEEVEPAAEADSGRTPPFLDDSRAGNFSYGQGEYEKALEHYQKAMAANPSDAESLSNLGQVLVRFGRVKEAIPHFERAIALNPGRWAYRFNLARAVSLQGDWKRSVQEYRAALDLFPDDYATHFNLARALHEAGDEAGATPHYERAIELNPNDGPFHLALANNYERLGRGADAAREIGRYLQLVPPDNQTEKLRMRLQRLQQSASMPAEAVPPSAR